MFRLLLVIFLLTACKKSGEQDTTTKFATIPQEMWASDLSDLNLLITKVHQPSWKIIYGFDYSCAQLPTGGLLQFDNGKKNFYVMPKLKKEIREMVGSAIAIWLKPLRDLAKYQKLITTDQLTFQLYNKQLQKDDNNIEQKFSDLAEDDGDLRIIFTCSWPDRHPRAYYQVRTIFSPLAVAVKKQANSRQLQELEDQALFSLLHEIGHIFGLSDTYVGGDRVAKGIRSASVMSGTRFYNTDRSQLVLAEDDVQGIRWLYKLSRRQVGKKDCPDGYEFIWNDNLKVGSCRPRDLLMHNIKSAYRQEKYHRNLEAAAAFLSQAKRGLESTIGTGTGKYEDRQRLRKIERIQHATIRDIKINSQDNVGNTPLHYLISYGAWSLFNRAKQGEAVPFDGYKYALYSRWLHTLTRLMELSPCPGEKICLDVNKQNNDGHTPLHYAIIFIHSDAVGSLLERPELKLTIKDNQQLDVCDHARRLKQNYLSNEVRQLRQHLGLDDNGLLSSVNPWSDSKREREAILHYLKGKCSNL